MKRRGRKGRRPRDPKGEERPADVIGKPLRATRREQLLAQAKAAQGFDPVAQRIAVNKLIHESVLSRACTTIEIFEAAYQDPQGYRYWELWLFEPLQIYQFAELLALDSAAASGVPVLDRYVFPNNREVPGCCGSGRDMAHWGYVASYY